MFLRPLLLALLFIFSSAQARTPFPVFTGATEMAVYMDEVLAGVSQEITAIKNSPDQDAEILLKRWDAALARLTAAESLFQIYHYGLKVSDDFKASSFEQITRLEKYRQAVNKDLDLYRIFERRWRREHHFADQESRELVERFLRGFEKNGVHLGEQQKKEILTLQTLLKEVQGRYSERVKIIQRESPFVVSAAKLYGLVLPPKVEVREGRAFVSVEDRDTAVWFLSNVPDENLRRAYFEHSARIHEPLRVLALEMLQLRRRIANKLGVATWAEHRLPGTMLQAPDNVRRFLDESTKAYGDPYRKHLDQMLRAKRDETGDDRAAIKPWDLDYYTRAVSELQEESGRANYAHEVVDADRLFAVTFAYLEEMFDLKIERSAIDAREAHLWSADAEVLTIYHQGSGTPLTQTYFEPYQHEGVKFGFALALDGDGPEARLAGENRTAVFGKLQKSASGNTKLSFTEARVLFHEFGHLLHHALGRTNYATNSGSWVADDFAEFPSMLFEWMRKSPKVRTALGLAPVRDPSLAPVELMQGLWGLSRAYRDHSLHASQERINEASLLTFENQAMLRTYGIEMPRGYEMMTSFLHPWIVGYDAIYYSYISGDEFAKRLWLMGQKLPEREFWRIVDEEVLRRGASRPELETSDAMFSRCRRLVDALGAN